LTCCPGVAVTPQDTSSGNFVLKRDLTNAQLFVERDNSLLESVLVAFAPVGTSVVLFSPQITFRGAALQFSHQGIAVSMDRV
jgi:hypothetical protein